jgi:GNAT superfamily N-acetyltransferase
LEIRVEPVGPAEWERVRQIRLDSLKENPEAFGATFESESARPERYWRVRLSKSDFVVASDDTRDIGIMFVDQVDEDFASSCWIRGCWVRPEARGKGVMRALIEYVDSQVDVRPWSEQGLGVWVDNHPAIKAYENIGFANVGEPQASTSQPGKFYQRMSRATPSKGIEGALLQ